VSSYSAENLYQLLPALYRQRDAEQDLPLRALVEILAEQAQVVERDIHRLYDNWFVETCEPWVVPYLADLVGIAGLSGEELRRGEVANTLAYRQRKGTPAVLEQLARDATGWPARVVPSFERIAITQHADHVRPDRRTVDLRRTGELRALGGAFDTTARTAEVSRTGLNLSSVRIHLWRLGAYPLVRVQPAVVAGDNHNFTFDPIGRNQQLFHAPVSEADVPAPITRRDLVSSIDTLYGPGRSLEIWDGDGNPVTSGHIVVCDLSNFNRALDAGQVAVDPVLGRIRFASPQTARSVRVSYHYGFSADLGGGAYEREASFPRIAGEALLRVGGANGFATIGEALTHWGGRGSTVIEIADSRTYEENLAIRIPADTRLEIRAANEERPTLRLSAELTVQGGERSRFEVNGLLIAGSLRTIGSLQGLTLRHTTLVPGALSLNVQSPTTAVTIERSILGGISTGADVQVGASDSILDAGTQTATVFTGGLLSLARATVIGRVQAAAIPRADSVLFLAAGFGNRIAVSRRHEGIVRFSYVPLGSQTPHRYRCQPVATTFDLAVGLTPRLTSLTWGDPGYCQLVAGTPDEIRRGAEDGSEMGAFASLRQPQREEYLRARLEDHLPAGLEAGIVFMT
jgi:hypothetical protein